MPDSIPRLDLVRLFHPRRDHWADHFEWNGTVLIGKTDIGRITVQVLAINDPDFMAVRLALMEEAELSPT